MKEFNWAYASLKVKMQDRNLQKNVGERHGRGCHAAIPSYHVILYIWFMLNPYLHLNQLCVMNHGVSTLETQPNCTGRLYETFLLSSCWILLRFSKNRWSINLANHVFNDRYIWRSLRLHFFSDTVISLDFNFASRRVQQQRYRLSS